ncbi:MAG: hypothetical protein GY697_16265 [Desulfobacterales bacterium]|nr:hypothetical protein [Desulfobacterales bacterium]
MRKDTRSGIRFSQLDPRIEIDNRTRQGHGCYQDIDYHVSGDGCDRMVPVEPLKIMLARFYSFQG